MKKFLAGILCGMVLFGGVNAYAAVLAERSSHKVTVDGQPVSVEAYNINGSNYFQLRDLARLLDVGIEWNSATRTVEISTEIGYTEEQPNQTTPAPGTSTTDLYDIRVEVVDMINDLRRQNGLSYLAMDDDLMEAAQVRAEEVASNICYSHDRPDGSDNDTVVRFTGDFRMGENMGAKDLGINKTVEQLPQIQVSSWASSSGHHRNILRPTYHSTGVGMAQDRYGMWYIVQVFAEGDYTILGVDEPILR